MSDLRHWMGLDIGGTQLKCIICDWRGQVLARHIRPTADDGSESWLGHVRNAVREILRDAGPIAGLGVAAPGLAAADGRSISFMPGRLNGLAGLDWPSFLDCPMPVRVLNDANAALLGEVWAGAARDSKNVMLITLGTGVGGAAMVDGHILRGHIGRAGHLGHLSLDPRGALDICNAPGSLELMIGECSLAERSGGRFTATVDLLAAAAAGDAEARRIWDDSVRALAAAIAGLVNVLDPEIVLLAGGVSHSGDALLQPLNKYLGQFEWRPGGARVQLKRAALGNDAGAIGAARYVQLCGDRNDPVRIVS